MGVIHRDIKPENILLQGGHALVADFGIALAVQQAGGQRMTQTGLSLGTPQYMSPEQAMGERDIDARDRHLRARRRAVRDAHGEPPFTGPTVQAIVAKVMTEKPAGLVARRERVPPAVEAAVLTALEKLPADRFASAPSSPRRSRTHREPAHAARPQRCRRNANARRTSWRSPVRCVLGPWPWLRWSRCMATGAAGVNGRRSCTSRPTTGSRSNRRSRPTAR